jgi:hypothetical protein
MKYSILCLRRFDYGLSRGLRISKYQDAVEFTVEYPGNRMFHRFVFG